MAKFPVDAKKARVIDTLIKLGFTVVREREHIILERRDQQGKATTIVLPNHSHIKSSTLRSILTQGGIDRSEFMEQF